MSPNDPIYLSLSTAELINPSIRGRGQGMSLLTGAVHPPVTEEALRLLADRLITAWKESEGFHQ